ncbi:hypothetical protein [Streptomyces sp. bgisy154]|uniref:hypothetical protein n=1 Tax=Streptomyces sp. bgisy154 TaxID=3413794 RepID=UPI003D717661
MSWEEWEQLKATAADRDTARMQLNQVPADQGASAPGGASGGTKDFASSPAEKLAAARAIEEHVEPDTRKSGDWADEQTNAAVKAFGPKDGTGWITATALQTAHSKWGEQVQTLMNRLAAEKAALRSTNTLFQNTDLTIGLGVRSISVIDSL